MPSLLTTGIASFGVGMCIHDLWSRRRHRNSNRPCSLNKPARLKMRAQDVVGRAGFLRGLQWPLGLLGRRKSGGTATLEKGETDSEAPLEEELARLTNPKQNVAIIGTRDCTYNHQQEIEALTQGHVERGHRIYTSGSSGTNSAVIQAVLNHKRPELLTVELPQSLEKQDEEIQENDHLQLAEAAAKCNSLILGKVDRLVVFATNRSDKYLSLVKEAKQNNVMVAAFNVDI